MFIPYSFIEVESIFSQFIFSTIIYTAVVATYFIFCHGKYGQTLGKKIMGIKVLDVSEDATIGFLRAFYRELPWIVSEVALFVYILVFVFNKQSIEGYEMTEFMISFIWMCLELITMFLNDKRRAIHDFLAGSVVVKV